MRIGNVSCPFLVLISNHHLREEGPKCNSGIIRPQEISVGATILLYVELNVQLYSKQGEILIWFKFIMF